MPVSDSSKKEHLCHRQIGIWSRQFSKACYIRGIPVIVAVAHNTHTHTRTNTTGMQNEEEEQKKKKQAINAYKHIADKCGPTWYEAYVLRVYIARTNSYHGKLFK